MTESKVWRKSSRSVDSANCVELHVGTVVAVRDSKNPGPELTTPELSQFIGLIKANRFASIA